VVVGDGKCVLKDLPVYSTSSRLFRKFTFVLHFVTPAASLRALAYDGLGLGLGLGFGGLSHRQDRGEVG
jgi:hypothetical protein